MRKLTGLAIIVGMVIMTSYILVGSAATDYTPLDKKEMSSITGSICLWCNNYPPTDKKNYGDGHPPACDGYFLYCQRDDLCLDGLSYGYCSCLPDSRDTVNCDKYSAVSNGQGGCVPGTKVCSNCATRERWRCKNPSGDADCALV
jgi:hypothetical protein